MKPGVAQMLIGVAFYAAGFVMAGPFRIGLITLGTLIGLVGFIKYRTDGEMP